MTKYDFSVHYDGPALENNSIPIRDLAPSLLSLSEAFQVIQRLNNPDETPVSLNIHATKKGSFVAELFLVNGPNLIKDAMNLLNGDASNAFINLTEYVGIFISVVDVIKKAADHHIKAKEEKQGQVTITLDNQTKLTMSEQVFMAYKNVELRKNVHDVVKPLNTDGIEQIDFYHDQKISVNVQKDDYQKFAVPEVKEKQLDTQTSIVYLQIINVAFEHGKWKFSDGSNQFFAEIQDEKFLEAVKKDEQRFGSTDTLKVKMQTEQYLDKEGKLKSNYTILQVLDHVKGSEQLELDLFDKD